MPHDTRPSATWATRLIASMPPGGAAVIPVRTTRAETDAMREVARREGWCWASEGSASVAPGTRSVVLDGQRMHASGLAGEVLKCTRLGVRSLLALGGHARAPAPRHGRAWLVREARRRYGVEHAPDVARDAALSQWRLGDIARARRTAREVTGSDLLSSGLAVALDLVVLESIIARAAGDLLEAESLARAALVAARLGLGEPHAVAKASLAVARVLVEQGHVLPGFGALHGLPGGDPAVDVISLTTRVRLCLASGAPEAAGKHLPQLEDLAARCPWSTVHLWDARARVRRAVHDWEGAREACARGEELARRYGWRRRVVSFGEQRTAIETERTSERVPGDMRRWIVVDDLVAVLETCQEQADEVTAITRVNARVMARLGACGVAVVAAGEHGVGDVLGTCGTITERPPWLQEILLSGVRRSVDAENPVSCGAAIRDRGHVIAVLHCEWMPGALVAPAEATALVDTAATALAPVVRSLVERRLQVHAGNALLAELVGGSRPMQAVRDAVMRAAGSPFPVLVEGESGSGKELVARAVHRLSPRRARRFVALNCAAMSDELVEAELFGHARGAFTGAVGERTGLFEEASEGTLFLDEVAELSPRAQAKLLRVLQEGEVRRVGENRARRVDVRVVAASNRPLAAEAQAGRFRADLLYRLDVIRIGVPPLRARLDDLPVLAVHLWRDLSARAGCRAALGTAVLEALARYDWPGNVRELQNVLATVAVCAPVRGVVPLSALPPHLIGQSTASGEPLSLDSARREFDARFVSAALRRAGGRQALAARELGLTRQGLAKLMVRLRLPASTRGARAGAA